MVMVMDTVDSAPHKTETRIEERKIVEKQERLSARRGAHIEYGDGSVRRSPRKREA